MLNYKTGSIKLKGCSRFIYSACRCNHTASTGQSIGDQVVKTIVVNKRDLQNLINN